LVNGRRQVNVTRREEMTVGLNRKSAMLKSAATKTAILSLIWGWFAMPLVADDAVLQVPIGPEMQDIPLEEIERAYAGKTPPEAVRMYLAIMRGSQMGPGEGWFGPGQARYTWDWLARRHDLVPYAEGIPRDQFRGPAEWFDRLDRNRDGILQAFDLDWSPDNPWVEYAYLTNRFFRKLDQAGAGRLTRDAWLAIYDKVAAHDDGITAADLRDFLLTGVAGSFLPGDAPTKEILLHGLFSGEVGSLREGPSVDEPAPDFSLQTYDDGRTIRLSECIGSKPVVLVFGNFTCGPFRSMYPEVDDLACRYRDQATFLGVYVRDAHPTDGWAMQSNANVGVSVAQPRNLTERRAVATQCARRLNPSIPLLVDDVDDSTGHAYSGMPARLYVIDTAGRVAYKSGRGPFGFKAGEMEQVLLMTLLDESSSAGGSASAGALGQDGKR
jgi:thiol-disulfide isomerase/thioredoxin